MEKGLAADVDAYVLCWRVGPCVSAGARKSGTPADSAKLEPTDGLGASLDPEGCTSAAPRRPSDGSELCHLRNAMVAVDPNAAASAVTCHLGTFCMERGCYVSTIDGYER